MPLLLLVQHLSLPFLLQLLLLVPAGRTACWLVVCCRLKQLVWGFLWLVLALLACH